ncbi:hypothetical protein LVJ85_04505 [Neisseria sp. Dent CA1/247]|uniref:hypothetical protein n=1 Tax=Neisseria sp. Dent CA1/247 TaxID=2912675 RepID=UPI001FCF8C8E|nr:hypothetical protein [Neisseria sp. Dent CA1/247]UOO77741.1 hypothetical protein LVJ85_04505 [Neisseria sp. Dent CA1/247]
MGAFEMAWRAYYTLKDAADELSREFNDTYTPADLVHYGAVGITDLCLNVFSENENIAHIATAPISNNIEGGNAQRFITSIMPDGFLLIPKCLLKRLECEEQVSISSFEYLKNEDGENISPEKYLLDFYWQELSEIEKKTVFFRLIKTNVHFQNVSNTGGEILPPDSSGYMDSKIIFSYKDLYITRVDFDRLKNLLREKITEKKAKQTDDRKSLFNIILALRDMLIDKGIYKNQAEIIEYLANEAEGHGLSGSNLRDKFAEANKLKKSN